MFDVKVYKSDFLQHASWCKCSRVAGSSMQDGYAHVCIELQIMGTRHPMHMLDDQTAQKCNIVAPHRRS